MADSFGQNEMGNPVQGCSQSKQPPVTYWIEIEMVGEDDSPIGWLEYSVVTADGNKIKGYLDDKGFARLEGLKNGGSCKVGFPGLDKDAWQFVETLPAR